MLDFGARPMIYGLIASDPTGVIGNNGYLPWYFPEETTHFRRMIRGHTIIMGRKTFEETPLSILSNCHSIFLSHCPDPNLTRVENFSNFDHVDSLSACLVHPFLFSERTNYVIGGANVINQFLTHDLIDGFILTIMVKNYVGDTRISIDLTKSWVKKLLLKTKDYSIYHLLNPQSIHYESLNHDLHL